MGIDGLRRPVRPALESVLGSTRPDEDRARDRAAHRPLGHGHLLRGFALLEALELAHAVRAPTVLVDDGEFEVVGEDPLRAAREGRILDEGSFSISIRGEEPTVDVPLSELLGSPGSAGRRVYSSTLDLMLGDWPTPLVRLRFGSGAGREVWAKLEWYNPFSLSVKDRTAWAMVADAARRGCLGGAIYEASSANTGLALSALSGVMGISCRIYLPSTAAEGVDAYFSAMGAEIVRGPEPLTVRMLGRVMGEAARDGAVVLNQFENDANFKVHLKYTARELREQLEAAGRRPDYIVGHLRPHERDIVLLQIGAGEFRQDHRRAAGPGDQHTRHEARRDRHEVAALRVARRDRGRGPGGGHGRRQVGRSV
jgi:Cysteine synthase